MPEVEYSLDTPAPIDAVWAFVKEIDNWAPFLTGYQRHEKLSDDESIWLVKGELGGLSRIAEFRVRVIEWAGPERVTFTLEGLQEPVNGSGSFLATNLAAGSTPPSGVNRQQTLRRLLSQLWRWLRLGVRQPAVADVGIDKKSAKTRLTFQLQVSAAGAAGPILNLLLAPLLAPVAENLARRIVEKIEDERA